MRITEKKENGFYELKKGQEIYGEENGIRLVQIVGEYEDIDTDPAHLAKIKQALQIIKTKDFIDLKLLKRCKTHYEYNRQVAIRYDSRGMDIGLLTEEEYALLKEVLL